MTVFITFTCSR